MAQQFKNGYFRAPNDIFGTENLTAHEKLVYLYICRCQNNSTAYPSYETIAKCCSISRRQAMNVIKKLVDKKLIVKETKKKDNGGHLSNTYHALDPSRITGGENSSLEGGEYDSLDGEQSAPNKESIDERNNNYVYKYLITFNEGYVFEYYARKYREVFKKEHPKMTEAKIKELDHNLMIITDKYSELIDNDEYWEEIIDYHFENLPSNNNGNILAFLSLNGGYGPVGRYIEELQSEDKPWVWEENLD